MRQRGRPARPLGGRGVVLLFSLLLVAASAGRPLSDADGKRASKQPDGVVAAKASLRMVAPLFKRLPSSVTDRLPGVDLPARKAWAEAGSGSSSDLTRPLYLQLFLPAHPQQRRAPPA